MASTAARAGQRRGRPPAGSSDAHRGVVLDAVAELLVERGYQHTTMAAVAQRAGSSKETLYAWFGSKRGLFTALVRRQAEAANQAVAGAFEAAGAADRGRSSDPAEILTAFAANLLRLLVGERSVALNRAAIAELGGGSPAGRAAPTGELAAMLLAQGRHRTGPIVEAYLARLAALGQLRIDDPADAFRLLYGLVVQDLQIRVLLGERPPGPAALVEQARTAVERFLTLTGVPQERTPPRSASKSGLSGRVDGA